MVGAFLKYGKLEAAEPCGDNQCSRPGIQYSKKFYFEDVEWMDDFLDLTLPITRDKMDEIAQKVPR